MRVTPGGVIVTGSAGGIGQRVMEVLSERGLNPVGVDRTPSRSTHVALDLNTLAEGGSAIVDARARLLAALDADASRLRGIINLAALQLVGAFDALEPQDYVRSFQVNALAPLLLVRALLPELRKGRATVINVSSIHAMLSKKRFSAYSASKAAMSALTRALAIELGDQLRVVEIRPAAIATDMLEAGFADRAAQRQALDAYHPTGRIGSPHEVATLCATLLTQESPFLNGAVINLDGGISHVLHDPD